MLYLKRFEWEQRLLATGLFEIRQAYGGELLALVGTNLIIVAPNTWVMTIEKDSDIKLVPFSSFKTYYSLEEVMDSITDSEIQGNLLFHLDFLLKTDY